MGGGGPQGTATPSHAPPHDDLVRHHVAMRVLISTKEAGIVIGQSGANVAEIRQQSGARVTVSDMVSGAQERVLTVAGPLDAVAMAFSMIGTRIAEKMRPLDPSGPPRGRTLITPDLRASSDGHSVHSEGLATDASNDADGTLGCDPAATTNSVAPSGGGSTYAASSAGNPSEPHPASLCGSASVGTRPISVRFLVPNLRMGSIIGRHGAKIKEIQDVSGSKITASEEMLPNSTERVVTVTGVVDAIHIASYHLGLVLLEHPERNTGLHFYKPTPGYVHRPPLPTNASSRAETPRPAGSSSRTPSTPRSDSRPGPSISPASANTAGSSSGAPPANVSQPEQTAPTTYYGGRVQGPIPVQGSIPSAQYGMYPVPIVPTMPIRTPDPVNVAVPATPYAYPVPSAYYATSGYALPPHPSTSMIAPYAVTAIAPQQVVMAQAYPGYPRPSAQSYPVYAYPYQYAYAAATAAAPQPSIPPHVPGMTYAPFPDYAAYMPSALPYTRAPSGNYSLPMAGAENGPTSSPSTMSPSSMQGANNGRGAAHSPGPHQATTRPRHGSFRQFRSDARRSSGNSGPQPLGASQRQNAPYYAAEGRQGVQVPGAKSNSGRPLDQSGRDAASSSSSTQSSETTRLTAATAVGDWSVGDPDEQRTPVPRAAPVPAFSGSEASFVPKAMDESGDSQLQVQEQVLVPNSMVGALIGRGGTRINEIRQTSGCLIRISLPSAAASTAVDPSTSSAPPPPLSGNLAAQETDGSSDLAEVPVAAGSGGGAGTDGRLVTITGSPRSTRFALQLLQERLGGEMDRATG
ncbi:hypothetical protein HK405_006574, partial [Cladochytrium tenue]